MKKLFWIVPLCLILLVVIGFFAIPLTESVSRTAVPGSDGWMAALPDDTPLSDIVIPGTHDSATAHVQLAYFSKCQALGIADQMAAGCRYLDIRLGTDDKTAGFKLMHGFTSCKTGVFGGALGLEAVLSDCYAFLSAHPTETVLFAAKYEHGDLPVPEVQARLAAEIAKNPDRWLLTDALPSLGEARGKLVLLRRWADEAGLGSESGIPFLWTDQGGRDNTSLAAAEEPQPGYTLFVQDRFKYDTEEKWAAFTAGLNAPAGEDGVVLSFLSTSGSASYGHPYRYAKALNPRLTALDDSALRGWIVTDFSSAVLAEKIYGANFA